MKVSELIALLAEQNPDAVIVIEGDDSYWHIADIDTAMLVNPDATNPKWNYDAIEDAEPYLPNAVRICI